MKKIFRIFAAMLIITMMPLTAQIVEAADPLIGNVLNTSIRVFINNHEIRGYNINGHTYVIAEDLPPYGFKVDWISQSKRLEITREQRAEGARKSVPLNTAPEGSFAYEYVNNSAVGITVRIYNRERTSYRTVTSYNIDGQTLVKAEDLAFNREAGHVIWDSNRRELLVSANQTSTSPPQGSQGISLQSAKPFFDRGTFTVNENGTVIPNTTTTATLNQIAPNSATMGGVAYSDAILYRSNVGETLFTLHNLNKEFNIFSGFMGRVDGSPWNDVVVTFILDGVPDRSYALTAGDLPKHFIISVRNVNHLRIEVKFLIGRANPFPNEPRTQYAIAGWLED